MLESFKMEISTDDMLRIINYGIRQLVGITPNLVEEKDKVVRIQYSRDAKRYTLVFESGRKLRVVPAEIKVDAAGNRERV